MSSVDKREAIKDRLVAAEDIFQTICSVTGNAGLSIGIMYQGEDLYEKHIGFSDVASKRPPNRDTIYHIGSITKGMVVAGLAVLVSRGELSWDKLLKELVPEYQDIQTETELNHLGTDANLIDILAHRLGITTSNGYWVQQQQQLLVGPKETARILAALEPVNDFRSVMTYSNWSYGLAGKILENLSGQSLDDFLQEHIFGRLGLTRTTLRPVNDENYANSYITMPNGSPFLVPHPPLHDGKVLSGAGSCKSSLSELMEYYRVLLKDANSSEKRETSSASTVFSCINDIWSPHIPIDENSEYGLGWALSNLPGKAGMVGVNAYESPGGMPIICRGIKDRQKLVYHNGAMAGALSAVYLLPESQTSIIILGNTFALCDTPDWIAQLITEIILDSPQRNDFVELAKKAAQNSLSHHPATQKVLDEERILGTSTPVLSRYTGTYFNALKNFSLEVTVHGSGLEMAVQGFSDVKYGLYHYHHDVFAWNCDREAETKRIIFPQWKVNFHRVSFIPNEEGNIEKLFWGFDGRFTDTEAFWKA